MDNNQLQKPSEILLSALCLKPAFQSTTKNLAQGQDKFIIKSDIRILWKRAAHIIPNLYGLVGEKAVKLMRMIAHLEDVEFNIAVLGDNWCLIGDEDDPQNPRIFDILASFGLLSKSNDWKFYITLYGEYRISGKIRLQSTVLLEVIREDYLGSDQGLRQKKQLLIECVQTFDLEDIPKHYNAIWTQIINSNWNDIILQFHSIGSFYERFFYDDNIDTRDKPLFGKTLLKYAELYGPYHEMTMKLRALAVSAVFICKDVSYEGKWNVWSKMLKPHLDIFIQTPTVEIYPGKRWKNLSSLVRSIIAHLTNDEFIKYDKRESLRLLDIVSSVRNTNKIRLFRLSVGLQFRHDIMHLVKSKSNPNIGENILNIIQRLGIENNYSVLNLSRGNLGSWISLMGRILDTIDRLTLSADIKDRLLPAVNSLITYTISFYSEQIRRNTKWDTQCFLPELELVFLQITKASGKNKEAYDYAKKTWKRRVRLAQNYITSERERIRMINEKIDGIAIQCSAALKK